MVQRMMAIAKRLWWKILRRSLCWYCGQEMEWFGSKYGGYECRSVVCNRVHKAG